MASETLWTFFVVAALGLTILVLALGAAITIAQRRFVGLHRAYGQRLLAAQDEERAWVAREVHDDVIQRLAVLRHEVAISLSESNGMDESHKRRLVGLEGEIMDLNIALRRLAHRLHPATLDHGGLQLNLEQLVEEAETLHGIHVHLEVRVPLDRVRGEMALGLYRIVQEAIRNVAKHAGVREAWLTAARLRGRIVLTIRDDGQGFDAYTIDAAGLEQPHGLGLHTVRERARQLGGKVGFVSAPGRGTTVTVSVPWSERA